MKSTTEFGGLFRRDLCVKNPRLEKKASVRLFSLGTE